MQAFQLGYKSTRKFHKPLYIWDHIERVSVAGVASRQEGEEKAEERRDREEEEGNGCSSDVDCSVHVKSFLAVVSQIDTLTSIGKDEKVSTYLVTLTIITCTFRQCCSS